jgi:hypothetical protein
LAVVIAAQALAAFWGVTANAVPLPPQPVSAATAAQMASHGVFGCVWAFKFVSSFQAEMAVIDSRKFGCFAIERRRENWYAGLECRAGL